MTKYYMESFSASVVKKCQLYGRSINKGLSLIEAAMVMALSAVVVAGVIAYYQSASDNQKAEVTTAMLTNLLSVVHSTYASQANYKGIKASRIANTGALPASTIKEVKVNGKIDKRLYSPGGGEILIQAGKIDEFKETDEEDSNTQRKNNYFVVKFSVNKKLCPAITRLDLGSSLSDFAIGEKSNKQGRKPLDVSKSQDVCIKAAATKPGNDFLDMYYEFH